MIHDLQTPDIDIISMCVSSSFGATLARLARQRARGVQGAPTTRFLWAASCWGLGQIQHGAGPKASGRPERGNTGCSQQHLTCSRSHGELGLVLFAPLQQWHKQRPSCLLPPAGLWVGNAGPSAGLCHGYSRALKPTAGAVGELRPGGRGVADLHACCHPAPPSTEAEGLKCTQVVSPSC